MTEKPHPANVLQETIGQLTELAEEIALQIPRAAAAADVTIDYATPREHDDPVQLIARELVWGIAASGWEVKPPTGTTDAVEHFNLPDPDRNPSCSCGYAPGPDDATSPMHAVRQIQEHIQGTHS